MTHSESIKEIATALNKAQSQMQNVKKTSANPFFKSKYADLAECWETARKPLADNGLSIIQCPEGTGSDVTIETILLHTSGEWISSKLSMKPVKPDPQGIGSCITYGRRYALCAIVGISPEDDDGNQASGKGNGNGKEQAKAPQQPQTAAPTKTTKKTGKEISDKQRTRLFAISKSNNVSEQQVKAIILKYGYESSKDIQWPDYEKICNEVESYGKLPEPDEQVNEDDLVEQFCEDARFEGMDMEAPF